MSEECIFCKIARGQLKGDFIYQSDNFFAIRDKHPQAKGHTLVIPKKHYVTILDLSNKLGNELLEVIKRIAGNLLESKYGDGFNLLMNNLEAAGQEIGHAHVHIIPRKEGDGIKLFTKV